MIKKTEVKSFEERLYCDKCGYETILPFDSDEPTILY